MKKMTIRWAPVSGPGKEVEASLDPSRQRWVVRELPFTPLEGVSIDGAELGEVWLRCVGGRKPAEPVIRVWSFRLPTDPGTKIRGSQQSMEDAVSRLLFLRAELGRSLK